MINIVVMYYVLIVKTSAFYALKMNIEKDVYQIQKILPLSIKTGQESDIGGSLGLSPPIISGRESLTTHHPRFQNYVTNTMRH